MPPGFRVRTCASAREALYGPVGARTLHVRRKTCRSGQSGTVTLDLDARSDSAVPIRRVSFCIHEHGMVQVQQESLACDIVASGRARAKRTSLRSIPVAAGCYVFRDEADAPLYVGKSVALRHRLASYFLNKRDRKTRAMLRHAHEVEWHAVHSEVEALILESQLIKRYQPPYNVMGREYPHYTFLRLNEGGGVPYLEICTSVEADGANYYGPFWGRRSAQQTLEFVNRLFKLRQCTGPKPTAEQGRGCFYAQAHRCSAPCLGEATEEAHGEALGSAGELLRGDVGPLVARLEQERDAAAEDLRFEQAALRHQMILTLRTLQHKRGHLRAATRALNFLVIVHRSGADPQVLAYSAGRLQGQLSICDSLAADQRLALECFILQHYPIRRQLSIDLDELDQMHVVAEWLARQGRRAAYIPLPEAALTATDAARAVEAVAEALAGPRPAPPAAGSGA